MANPLLFKSAVVFGTFHILLAIQYAPLILELTLILGVITSIYNHGTTSAFAKWLDRVAITLASITDLIYIFFLPESLVLIVILLFSVTIFLYFAAKWDIKRGGNGNIYHLWSHILATILHSVILLYMIEHPSILFTPGWTMLPLD